MNSNHNNDYFNFRKALIEVLKTPNGEVVLEGLEKLYVKQTAMTQDTNSTMYRLGQKELVQSIIEDSKIPLEDLKKSLTINN